MDEGLWWESIPLIEMIESKVDQRERSVGTGFEQSISIETEIATILSPNH
jgi:hypothetical protein